MHQYITNLIAFSVISLASKKSLNTIKDFRRSYKADLFVMYRGTVGLGLIREATRNITIECWVEQLRKQRQECGSKVKNRCSKGETPSKPCQAVSVGH